MAFRGIIWDLDDEPDGNVQHCGEHGVSKEETVCPVTAYEVPRSQRR